jgi:hypothetical protein
MEDGGPSQTARRVAAHRLDFTRVPADYGEPAADEALAIDVAAGRQAPASRMHDYLAARTAFFDRAVTGALGRTVAQVVVGAAGYDGTAPEAMPLSALLSRVLLSFAVEYEREAGLSLAVAANVLRVLGTDGTRLRDLPALTGTSKESVRWALGILTRGGLAAEEPDPAASRGNVARLTPRGLDAQCLYHELTSELERRWHARFTPAVTVALRASLEPLAAGQPPPLSGGLEPYPDNWRASVRRPDVLPHFPMVLHRGGYPDGS